MYLPKVFKQFIEHHGEIAGKFKEVGELCSKAGNLETKTQHLVQLGISIGAGSIGGVKSHARRALDAGASQDDLLQATLLSATVIGFPAMIAAYGWVEEVISHIDAK
ncbi:MAG: carboxymuconolactone decarboxylase family protein [Desulfomonilaceae bacterium]